MRPPIFNLRFRSLIALMVLCCASPARAVEESQYPYTGAILGYDTNVRAGSNLNYEIVTRLEKGELVYVAGQWREWRKIRCPDDTPLWVSSEYIEDGVVIGSKVNVRSGPTLRHNVICQILREDKVEVMEKSEDGEWVGIKAPEDAYLWVHESLVEKKGGPNLYSTFLRRRAEVRKRLSNAEVVRKLNMRKDPSEVPFGEMIAEYETIATEYADFDNEAKLALKRAEELRAMKKQLDDQIAAEKKAREEREEKKAFVPRYLTAKGTVAAAEGTAGGRGILRLKDGSRLVCMVKSETIDLKQYMTKHVQVWGMEEFNRSWDVPVIDVTRVKSIR